MERIVVRSFEEYIKEVLSVKEQGIDLTLFRGQTKDWSLLPSISRYSFSEDVHFILQEEPLAMEALKRRAGLLVDLAPTSMWDWLVLAQHFGMRTRLLDWTSNPLTALWFACQDENLKDQPSYVYKLPTSLAQYEQFTQSDPLRLSRTIIYFPNLGNKRVSAQAGYFTAFGIYGNKGSFVPLDKDPIYGPALVELEISPEVKVNLLDNLSKMGVDSSTIFADLEGLCKHLNRQYYYAFDVNESYLQNLDQTGD